MIEPQRPLIDAAAIDRAFLTGPGGDLVDKLIMQMQKVRQFRDLFGQPNESWANYNRFDWPVRSLPAINVLEAAPESKSSDAGYLTGAVQLQIYWPSEFRRSDLARVSGVFKGVLENFFNSQYVSDMLDELYLIQRDAKVYGLNELGKTLTWTPNTEGMNSGDMTPMTIVDVQYRIDLRAWDRAMEYMGRTVENPFEKTLGDLTNLFGEIDGVNDNNEVKIRVPVDAVLNED